MEKAKPNATEEDVITINIQHYITPIAIILSGIIIASSILIGLNNLATALKGSVTTTTTTANTGTTQAGTATVTKDSIAALINDSSNLKFGDSNKKVLIAEFSDPSCPYCHIASGKNPELNQQAGSQFLMVADGGTYVAPVPEFKKLIDSGEAAYVWLYTNGHGNGQLGSIAMYCANEQGKFWAVHDQLFSSAGYSMLNDVVKNDKSKSSELADFLASSVDKNFMKSCLESNKYDSKLAQDEQVAASFGVSGTPGFYVNETNFAGAYSFTEMQATINTALGK